jgi:hypothetical protein
MILRLPKIYLCLIAGGVLIGCNPNCFAQAAEAQAEARLMPGADGNGAKIADGEELAAAELLIKPPADMPLPDAPLPQQTAAQAQEGSSSSAGPAAQVKPDGTQQKPDDAQGQAKTQEQLADEQLKQEKKQRVLGFMPSFNTSYNSEAVSLTKKQKFKLAFSQATDPFQFLIAGIAGGISEAEGSDAGYGGGPLGYFKRVGADYADSFDGAMIGNALLPSILHQDPRYFRRGYGSAGRRIFYAFSTSFICKHDNTGKWEPNYSNMGGNLVAGAISTVYVPEDERTAGNVFEGFALVTLEGAGGAILQEFWPDISRRLLHKDPTHGQDAINRAKHGY